MMQISPIKAMQVIATACLAFSAAKLSTAASIPDVPLVTQVTAKPMVMLTVGKDHRMFYEAYNDASDIDGDGLIDVGFKPSITYYGLFDSRVCYTHTGPNSSSGMFRPGAVAGSNGTCSGSARWSGNWLNYATTSRIDALRKVLYGGFRDVDSSSQTVLRRAYIPQDAHSWAKSFTSPIIDGYKISDYTPFAEPTGGARIFFGNLTANRAQNCSNLNDCSNLPPLLRVRTGVGSTANPITAAQWASKERPVLDTTIQTATSTGAAFPSGTSAAEDYTVRVEVCTSSFNDGCKGYPNGTFKPIGVLHDYGENNSMLFGLMTGSYDKHMSGGRLRKVVSSFKEEVDGNTGQFLSAATIVQSLNSLRIRGFNQSSNSQEYWKSNPYTDSARAPIEGELVDWFNPIGEIMYESVRYFAGKKAGSPAYLGSTTFDNAVGLPTNVTWDDPYSSSSKAKAPYCARPSMLVLSDISPSFDSDQLPGSYFNSSYSSDMPGSLNVKTEADFISSNEDSSNSGKPELQVSGARFIGQSNTTAATDRSPTAKTVTSLGTIRGLAPDDPAKEGSYYSAAVASWAHRNSVRTDLPGKQGMDTFVVALSTPLPKIIAKLPNGREVTVIPFAKSVAGSGINSAKGNYQPTNQIVDFYVTKIANSGTSASKDYDPTINGGRYFARFQINFEDVEQGGDHDMDAIAEYVVRANADNTVSIWVTPRYQAGGMVQTMGYVISGTTADGVYLVARDEPSTVAYFLNVPSGGNAVVNVSGDLSIPKGTAFRQGVCDVASTANPGAPRGDCSTLPHLSSGNLVGGFNTTVEGVTSPMGPEYRFTAGSTGAVVLRDPLWYAAKWGGFIDKNGNNRPDQQLEWDVNKDGTPDNYFLVQNPVKLKETLQKAFNAIATTNSSASNVIANSTSISTETRVFQARFESNFWSGDLVAYPVSANGVSTNTDWEASTKLPPANERKIFIRNTDGVTREFQWSSMPASDKALLGSDPDVLSFLRGDRSGELNNSGNFRNRAHALGDLVHSSPFFLKESSTVFVGGNDGMLHAFNARTGVETMAFIPTESIANISKLASPSYSHRFLVDGDVTVTGQSSTTNSQNLLFASLGRGGKGLFSLNVTDVANFSSSNALWEYTPSASAVAQADKDLGFMLGRPVFVTLNNGLGAVLIGNGYNSVSESAVLYVFILNTSGAVTRIIKLQAGSAGGDNGLATPGTFDSDGDGKVDFAYAGDLKGNLWKFDLSSANPDDWKVALTGKPLFVATDNSGNRQPITGPVTISKNQVPGDDTEGKRFVFLGTGSYFRSADPSDTSLQSWYGIIDNDLPFQDYLPAAGKLYHRDFLKTRTLSSTSTFTGKPVRYFGKKVANDMKSVQGWKVDFALEPGERIITESVVLRLKTLTLAVSSIIPSSDDPCVPGGRGFLNALDPYSGTQLESGVFDINGNKNYADDLIGSNLIGSVDLGVGLPSRPTLIGNRLVVGGTDPVKRIADVAANPGLKPLKGRISWREIVGD